MKRVSEGESGRKVERLNGDHVMSWVHLGFGDESSSWGLFPDKIRKVSVQSLQL